MKNQINDHTCSTATIAEACNRLGLKYSTQERILASFPEYAKKVNEKSVGKDDILDLFKKMGAEAEFQDEMDVDRIAERVKETGEQVLIDTYPNKNRDVEQKYKHTPHSILFEKLTGSGISYSDPHDGKEKEISRPEFKDLRTYIESSDVSYCIFVKRKQTSVYLDQNKWIELAQAIINPKEFPGYEKAIAFLDRKVESGEWVFPLSAIHFFETLQRVNNESRVRLAKVMSAYSKNFSIPPFYITEPVEFYNSFAAIHAPKKHKIFCPIKKNLLSAIGINQIDLKLNSELPSTVADKVADIFEKEILGDEALFSKLMGMYDDSTFHKDMETFKKESIQDLESLQKRILSYPKDFAYKIFLIDTFLEVLSIHLGYLYGEFGKTKETLMPDEILASEEKTLQLLESVPSLTVRLNLIFEKYKNGQSKVHKNDEKDILFLASAIPYCDIVVTENSWAHSAITRKLDSKYSCVILSDVLELMKQ